MSSVLADAIVGYNTIVPAYTFTATAETLSPVATLEPMPTVTATSLTMVATVSDSPILGSHMSVTLTPNTYTMAVEETLPLAFDCSTVPGNDQTITNATSTLTNERTGVTVSIASPVIAGTTISQEIVGSDLAVGQSYLLVVSFELDSETTRAFYLTIQVPF